MTFCDECGSLLSPDTDVSVCRACSSDNLPNITADGGQSTNSNNPTTSLEQLPTTDSGAVRKRDAVRWLEHFDPPSNREFKEAITPKPNGFTGSTFPTDISTVRVTGDAEFIETIAGLFGPLLEMEDHRNRLEINLQRIEDRDTGELTDNYALYLSVAERG